MTSLYELLIKSSKGDNEAQLSIIEKFQPLLRKYARYLEYEDAYDDLVCDLIAMCKSFDAIKLRKTSDAALLSYIKVGVINIYKVLLKRVLKEKGKPVEFKGGSASDFDYIEIWDKLTPVEDEHIGLEYDFLLSILTKYEAEIVILFYFHRHSVKDIAQFYHVKPPAICQAKSSALRKLRKYYTEENHDKNGGV